MTKPIYSLIIPIYNEEENITEMYRRLINVTAQLDGEVELILIDDGCRDRSLSMIRELHHCDRCVRYLSFARNFGHQIAVTDGLNFVQSKSIIVMDADLQDPPELILKMIEKWQNAISLNEGNLGARVAPQPTSKFTKVLQPALLGFVN